MLLPLRGSSLIFFEQNARGFSIRPASMTTIGLQGFEGSSRADEAWDVVRPSRYLNAFTPTPFPCTLPSALLRIGGGLSRGARGLPRA